VTFYPKLFFNLKVSCLME